MTPDEVRALTPGDAANLVDYAERQRIGSWSLRSSLVRYAQQAPVAASAVLELLRRTDTALAPHRREIERTPIGDHDAADPSVVDLLAVAAMLDELGDTLAVWAAERAPADPPTAAVDRLAGAIFERLAALGIPRENRPPRRSG
ncbi:MAG: hypothetical protein OSA99_17825 [Acidimicrobiales bacterium]|nr:hypothetical protein [Acidimicrobiales bacterium]